jgi:predicted transcriptional regulator
MSQTEARPFAQRSLEEWQVEEIEEAIREADRGEFASSGEVRRTLEKWTRCSL